MWRRDVRAAVRFEKVRLKKPAASFPARAFEISCDGEYLPVICPTSQNLF
jgi:hypothetical protein